MSSSENSDMPNFENVDYGELGNEYKQYNSVFKGLDIETKKKLFRDFPNEKNAHIGILKNISDPQKKKNRRRRLKKLDLKNQIRHHSLQIQEHRLIHHPRCQCLQIQERQKEHRHHFH